LISKKKVKLIKKKCLRGEKYNEKKVYFGLMALALVLIITLSIFEYQKTYVEKIFFYSLGFSIIFFPLAFLYFVLSEFNKYHSLTTIKRAIFYALTDDWDWELNFPVLLSSPSNIHPLVCSHPTTIYLFGNYLIKNKFQEDGEYLIKISMKKDPNLKSNFNDMDAQYLLESYLKERKFKLMFFFHKKVLHKKVCKKKN